MTNNRFSFRAFVNGSCYTSQGDDKEILISLNSVAVYGDKLIGISYDDLIEAVNKATLDKRERETLIQYFDDNNSSGMEEWFVLEADVLEQCTGLEDKNGRLIYEGDIVKRHSKYSEDEKDVVLQVEWNRKGARYITTDKKHDSWIFSMFDYEYEILGNIHENPELLEEKK